MSKEYQDINSKQTILEHGQSVCSEFKKLFSHLSSETIEIQSNIPTWFYDYKDILVDICIQHFEDICTYLIYHDCGKPFCLTIDDHGKRHFPNHAKNSKEIFLKYSDNLFIANLIEKDMLCHITKPKDFEQLCNEPFIEILLCASLAELHSNALMFGGFASDSFKIKFKNLDKLGKRILSHKYSNNLNK